MNEIKYDDDIIRCIDIMNRNVQIVSKAKNIQTINNFITQQPTLVNDAFLVACAKANNNLITKCLEHRVDINHSHQYLFRGDTPLMIAFLTKNKELFYNLLKHKPNLHIKNRQGYNIAMLILQTRVDKLGNRDACDMLSSILSLDSSLIKDDLVVNRDNSMTLALSSDNTDYVLIALKYGATFSNYTYKHENGITYVTNPLFRYYNNYAKLGNMLYTEPNHNQYKMIYIALQNGADFKYENYKLVKKALEKKDNRTIYRLLLFGLDSNLPMLDDLPYIQEWRNRTHRFQQRVNLLTNNLVSDLSSMIMSYTDEEAIIPLGDDEEIINVFEDNLIEIDYYEEELE